MSLRNKLLLGLLVVAIVYIVAAGVQLWLITCQQNAIENIYHTDLRVERDAERMRYIVLDMQRNGFHAALVGDEYRMMTTTGHARHLFKITGKMLVSMKKVGWSTEEMQLVLNLETRYRDILSALLAVFSDAVERIQQTNDRLEKMRLLSENFNDDLDYLVARVGTHLNQDISEFIENIQLLIKIHLFAFAILLGLILLVALFLDQHFSRPVAQIETFLGESAKAGGVYDKRLLLHREDELGRIAQAVNNLLDKLRETTVSHDQLEVVNSALEESENKFRSMADSAQDAILELDGAGRISFWNRAAERMFGYSRDEMIGKEVHRVLAPAAMVEDGIRGFQRFQMSGKGVAVIGRTVELVGVRKDGVEFPFELSASAVRRKTVWGAVGIVRDVTRRKHYEAELESAKQEAERANRAKTEFLATMSHEIRTPMNAILGMGELLQDTKLSEAQAWYVKTLNQSGEVLLEIINSILDLSKIEAGEINLEQKSFDLHQLVADTVELFRVSCLEKGIRLDLQLFPTTSQWYRGDPTRLRQILLNLIGNAVKFTQKGDVTVMVQPQNEEQVTFIIQDSGPGMPQDSLEKIFQPFVQVDAFKTRKHRGTGLGLAICQRLVELMEGTIAVQSELGYGSTFSCTLPLPRVSSECMLEQEKLCLDGVLAERQKLPDLTHNILLVDDSEENRLVIRSYLRKEKCRLEIATNGLEAVEKFRNGRFDLVLMDIQMPIMDGYEATRTIRAWEVETGADPSHIIALTAHALSEESAQIMQAGCDLHLTKPIRKARLMEVLREYQP